MARTLLPVVGGVIGGMIGGPMGARIGFAAGSVLGSIVDPVRVRGPSIGETGAQTSAEGAPRAIVYGTAPVTGNVIACGALVRRWVRQSGGGKGAPKVRAEHVYRTFAVRISEGPVAGVLRAWEDDKLVYDVRPESPILAESHAWIANKTIYLGTEDQLPDPVLQAQVSGAEDTPAYRGTAYIVIDSEDLTDRRGSIPQYRFEVSSSGESIPLESVPTAPATGSTGGGTFPSGSSVSVYLDGPSFGPGEVWFVYLLLRSTSGVAALSCYARVDGHTFWTQDLSVGSDWVSARCQLNHAADHSELVFGFDGHLTGQYQRGVAGLQGPSAFRAYPAGAEPPLGYDPSSPYFGVVVGPDDAPYSAGQVLAAGGEIHLPWGPSDLEVVSGGSAPLGDVVSAISARCGLLPHHLDVSELAADRVSGLVLAGDYSGSDAIDTLRRVYFFDRSECDGKVRFPMRGKPVVAVLSADDLVEDQEASTREQSGEYPAKLHLFYQHAASGYARVKATAQRSSPDVRVVGEISAEVPVVLDEDEAARISHKMHKASWADAEGEVKISLPESFVWLVPADCVGLSLRDRVRRLRIEEVQLADGRLHMALRVDRQSAYTSDVTGVPLPAPTPPPGTIVGATALAVLDIPSRLDSEDDLNIYYAVSAVEPAWYGALVERSMDSGANWADAAQIGRAMVIGVLTADLSDASEHYTDATNRVRLRLYRQSQEIESITDQQFLSGGGSFAVQGPGGGWEVMQYRDAEDLGYQEYELSMLHRGRLATETTAHTTGALVVFLDDVEHVAAQAAWIGQPLTHRATSFGETSESAADQTTVYEGRSQIEWQIAYLMLERDSSDIVSGSWTPRHRFGSDDFPVPSINFTGYRVTIDDGVETVVIDTAAPEFNLDASAMASPVTVSVAALNRITGAGPATSDTV